MHAAGHTSVNGSMRNCSRNHISINALALTVIGGDAIPNNISYSTAQSMSSVPVTSEPSILIRKVLSHPAEEQLFPSHGDEKVDISSLHLSIRVVSKG